MQVLIIGDRLNKEILDLSLEALSELILLKQGCFYQILHLMLSRSNIFNTFKVNPD